MRTPSTLYARQADREKDINKVADTGCQQLQATISTPKLDLDDLTTQKTQSTTHHDA